MEWEVQHFLDMIKFTYLPSARKAPYESQEMVKLIPSATELVAARVKQRRSGSRMCHFLL